MRSLVKNYINLLSIDKIKSFALKNDIQLSDNDLEFILNLVKDNYEDIIINENKYLKIIKDRIDVTEYNKIEALYLLYKNKYKGYIF